MFLPDMAMKTVSLIYICTVPAIPVGLKSLGLLNLSGFLADYWVFILRIHVISKEEQ